jgi:hypothetical protein
VVEEGENVLAAPPKGAAELGDLLQPCRHAAADRVDHRGQGTLAAAAVRIGVGEAMIF